MKLLQADPQLPSVSLSYYVALQALKPKASPRRRRVLDASTDRGLTERSGEVFSLDILSHRMSRVENRRSGFSLPVAADETFASSPQSGLAWLCFLFPLIEPDRRISRIRLSEKTHAGPCDAACNF